MHPRLLVLKLLRREQHPLRDLVELARGLLLLPLPLRWEQHPLSDLVELARGLLLLLPLPE